MLSDFCSRIFFVLLNCFGWDNTTSSSDGDYSLEDLPDDFLNFLLDHNENMLKNEIRIAAHPEEYNRIQLNAIKVIKEQHKRKLFYCFDEIRILHKFKENKKELVVEWLNGIDLNDIEPLEEPALKPLILPDDEDLTAYDSL